MKRIPLRTDWLMASERDVLALDPKGPECRPECWLPVEVPTTVQAALVDHGRAPDPWMDWNAKAFKKFEGDDWWFRREFELPEDAGDYDAWELRFEGVSLFGMVWLNGEPIGYTHNAQHEHCVDITPYVKTSGKNVLAVSCGLRLEDIRRALRPEIRAHRDAERPFMRLPQMSSGWDFAPHLWLTGLWRPVTLVGHRRASIEDVFVQTEALEGQAAQLTIAMEVRSFGRHAQPAKVHLAIYEDEEAEPVWTETVEVIGDGKMAIPATLAQARLWYPQPLGEPFRYVLKARVECDGEEVDVHTSRFGVRTVELRQDDQFTFVINGQEVFAKGANWVPPNSLTWDGTPEQYRHLIELAANAHFNMFRMWGGGIYEPECFYDLCDQHGIMIWQDFMFGNTRLPDDDPVFMERITKEARAVVTRLRRHACVVLWCGNNESLEAWNVGEWPDEAERHFGERVYFSILPQAVRQLSPGTPYWPGSPYGGATTRSLTEGDFHDWYSLPDWRSFDKNAPRFSSEYGCRAVPQRETVDAMISPQYQWESHSFQHAVWGFHHGKCGWLNSMVEEFGTPKSLDEHIAITQELQATMMRYAVEVYRRRMYGTSGSLIWQYNEPWPAVTFSLVDFFGRAKASYYWVRGACAPILGMFYLQEGQVSFWGVNDLREERPCTVCIRRFGYDGRLLGEADFEGTVAANGATRLVEKLPDSLRIQEAEREFLHGELRCGETVSERTYHMAARKDWALAGSTIKAACSRVDVENVRVEISAPGYVHFVGLTVEDPAARFSDNFFDLLPNEPRTIDIRTKKDGAITVRAANAPQLSLEL